MSDAQQIAERLAEEVNRQLWVALSVRCDEVVKGIIRDALLDAGLREAVEALEGIRQKASEGWVRDEVYEILYVLKGNKA